MWATYNEWKANNRIVDKGQVCQLRDPEHRALFHHSQTVEPKQEHNPAASENLNDGPVRQGMGCQPLPDRV